MQKFKEPAYISERSILTPTNQTVHHLNNLIMERLPGDVISYFSYDKAEDFRGTDVDLDLAFPTEYLNIIIIPGMHVHEVKLKEVVVVILIYNLNLTLCSV